MYEKVQQLTGTPITLTAGAGATTLMEGPVAGDGSNTPALGVPYEGVLAAGDVLAETASAVGAATLTLKVQKRDDGGTYTDVLTKVIPLRGVLGLLVPDRVTVPFQAHSLYGGQDSGSVQVRVTASCTGANVVISQGELHCQWPSTVQS
jgi:hypothetical protein